MSTLESPTSPPKDRALWFYADAENRPVGPLTFGELKELSATGIIRSDSFVIEEGGSAWKTLASIISVETAAKPPAPLHIEGRRWPTFLALFLLYPLGVFLLWRSKSFTKRAKVIKRSVWCFLPYRRHTECLVVASFAIA